jgi:hypothetical protein
MARAIWSTPIEGEHSYGLFVHEPSGRIIVSTTRRVENEPREAGLKATRIRRPGEPECFANDYACKCLAFEPGGTVAWQHSELVVTGEDANGSLAVGANTSHSRLLDSEGRVTQNSPAKKVYWDIVGFDDVDMSDGDLRLEVPQGAIAAEPPPMAPRVGAHVYWLHGNDLHRYELDGSLVSRVTVPDGPRKAKWEALDQRPSHDIDPCNPRWWSLVYDPRTNRLLATTPDRGAWLMALDLDGSPRWAEYLSNECCNFKCILLDDHVIVHVSSCGRRVTFLRDDGTIFRRHDFPSWLGCPFRHGEQVGVVVPMGAFDRVALFDAMGEPTWATEERNVVEIVSDGRLVYVLGRDVDERLVLKAFAVG